MPRENELEIKQREGKFYLADEEIRNLIRTSSIDSWVIGEIPSGAKDSSNRRFITSREYYVGTLRIFLNGLRKVEITDYTLIDSHNFEMASAPAPSDILVVDYVAYQ